MTGRRRRSGLVVSMVVTATMGLVLVGVPAAHAGPAPTSVSVTASPATLRVGNPERLTATVRFGSNPAPDGTLVRFNVSGPPDGLFVDNVYGGMAADATGGGYWLAGEDGAVRAFGDAPVLGGIVAATDADPVLAIAATPTGLGYYLLQASGTVHAFGDAVFKGDEHANADLTGLFVAMATVAGGYFLLGADGSVFAFGAAVFHGDFFAGDAPAIGIAATPDGTGYWVVDGDGVVDQFGLAPVLGNADGPEDGFATGIVTAGGTGAYVFFDDGTIVPLGSAADHGSFAPSLEPVTAMATRPDHGGYWVVSLDGVVRAAGTAAVVGDPYIVATAGGVAQLSFTSASPGTSTITADVLNTAATSTPVMVVWAPPPPGYWLTAADGGVFAYGTAAFHGSTGGVHLDKPIVGMAPTPDRGG
jgi:hypothetical protein